MFSLSLRERILVTAVLSAAVLGAAVKHWRDACRETQVLPSSFATQSSPAGESRYSHGQPHP